MRVVKFLTIVLCVLLCFNVVACGGQKKPSNERTGEESKEPDKDKIVIINMDLSASEKEKMLPYSVTQTFLLSKDDANTNDYGITWYVKDDSVNKANGNDNLVQIVKKDGNMTESTVSFDNAEQVRAERSTTSGLIYFQADVENLENGATYFWRCGNGAGVFSEVYTIEVPSQDKSTFNFAYVTDTQNQAEYSPKNYLHKALEYGKSICDYDFIINAGDFVQEGKDDKLWKEMLESKLLINTPVMAISGNHDYWSQHSSLDGVDETFRHYRNKIETQGNNNESFYYQDTSSGAYYSYDYGDCHFVMVNVGDIDNVTRWNAQLEWLKRDLKKNTKKWTILTIHEPFYSLGKYGQQTSAGHYHVDKIRSALLPIIQGKVDLVLQGHDHALQYTYPLKDGVATDLTPTFVEKKVGTEDSVQCLQYRLNGGTAYAMAGAVGEQNRNSETVSNYEKESAKSIFAYCLASDVNRGEYYQKGSFFSIVSVSNEDITVSFYGFLQNSDNAKLMTCFSLVK